MLEPGDQLGDWIIDKALGAGGMGSVYRCHSVLSTDVLAAVKVLTPSNLSDVEGRFVQEMRTLAQLNHPAIVRVLGGGRHVERGLLYMAMELVDGEDLDSRFRRGAMDPSELSKVFGPVADALAYAHARGVAHRDIKPGNIMLRRDGSPVIVDFGIAVVTGQTRHTRDGMVPGTLVYLPPELFEGEAPDPVHTDAYALGVVMWEASTGETAFTASAQSSEGQQMAAVMGMKLRAEALDPGQGVSDGVREAVLRTTDPDPANRLTDLTAVRELVAGRPETVELPPRTTTRRAGRGRRRGRGWVLPAILVTLLLLLLAGGAVLTALAGAGAGAAWWMYGGTEVAQRGPPVPLDQALGRVASASAAGDRVEARVHAGRALDDHPEDPHANLAYGQVLLADGELLLARPYLCAAVAGGLGAEVPGHGSGELDCARGPGASMPLTSPVALANLDVSAALADLSTLTAARQGDATASLDDAMDGDVADDFVEEAVEAPAPAPKRARSAAKPPPPAMPEPEPAASAPPPMAEEASEIGALAGGGVGDSAPGSASGSGSSGYGSGTTASKTASPGQVSLASLTVDGPRDTATVRSLLNRRKKIFMKCFSEAQVRDPKLSGRIVFAIRIAADGTVTGVSIESDTVGGDVGRCSVRYLARVRFPTANADATATLTLDFGG